MIRYSFRVAGLALCLFVLLRAESARALDVFACEPEWGALAQELGGNTVTVFSATTARQDPHQIQARPSLISQLRAADLVVCTGAELEIGWMPILLRQSAYPAEHSRLFRGGNAGSAARDSNPARPRDG